MNEGIVSLDTNSSPSKMLVYFRSDKTLQDIVYKLVPGLFKSKCKKFILIIGLYINLVSEGAGHHITSVKTS